MLHFYELERLKTMFQFATKITHRKN